MKILLAGGALCCGVSTALAQSLGPASPLEGVEFSRITGIRELADGRVLVADMLEKRLSVVDFARQTSTAIGRAGDGPGEYRGVSAIIPLAGDSSFVTTGFGQRWLLMSGASIAGVVTANDPPITFGVGTPLGADRAGRVLTTKANRDISAVRGELKTNPADSSWVVVVSRMTGRADTLGKVLARPARIAISGGKEIQSVSITMNPLSVGEQAVMFPDGAVAIARLNPYRVDWITPTGARVAAKPLPFEAIAIGATEKSEAVRRQAKETGEAEADPASVIDWPAVIPPFLTGGVLPAPDGTLWIRRTPSMRAPGSDYDVIDRTGGRVRQVHLAPNQRVAGFGASRVYVVTVDDDGIQRLSRHELRR